MADQWGGNRLKQNLPRWRFHLCDEPHPEEWASLTQSCRPSVVMPMDRRWEHKDDVFVSVYLELVSEFL